MKPIVTLMFLFAAAYGEEAATYTVTKGNLLMGRREVRLTFHPPIARSRALYRLAQQDLLPLARGQKATPWDNHLVAWREDEKGRLTSFSLFIREDKIKSRFEQIIRTLDADLGIRLRLPENKKPRRPPWSAPSLTWREKLSRHFLLAKNYSKI